MMVEFILLSILGWMVFAAPANKTVLMVVFIVLMVLWLVLGVTGFNLSHLSLRN